jgi:ribonuclease BN (tRNA processing enzyme)
MEDPMRLVAVAVCCAAALAGCNDPGDTPPTTIPLDQPASARTDGALAVPPQGAPRVVMLGTGTPNADPERSGPSVAVIVGGKAYLVDAGPGVVRRAASAALAGEGALDAANLDVVFLTHLHTDHTVGLTDLMFTPWVLEREAPLRVFGPPGTAAMTGHLHAAYAEDIRIRVEGFEPANETGHEVVPHEIEPGVVYEDTNVRVVAFAVPHGTWEHAFGYRFETADRTIVISGDTGPTEVIAEACNGCDLLVHEVYSTEGFAGRAAIWQRYHSSFHTSTAELADIASRARPGAILLYHQLYWGTTDDVLIAEMRAAGWTGPLASARDLGVY